MRVGVVGLGKLGFPVAVAMASRGLEVFGYDLRPEAMCLPEDTSHEEVLAEAIEAGKGNLHFVGLTELVLEAEVIFVAVETPHSPEFEGVTPLPEDRADFDYTALKAAVSALDRACRDVDRRPTIAVISTVLPGTMAREIKPLTSLPLVYNPSFIAMGTTIQDFLDPEFVLLGGDDGTLLKLYRNLLPLNVEIRSTSIENAELIKVAYNTFIGLKIAFANTLMEVCHKTDCDVDEVTGALKLANRRLISGAYLDGGMGDGGACHPRDNIALSWLARELDLSYDLFGGAMECREEQARWLGDLMLREARTRQLPLGILGVAYKPGSHITTGSAALLVKNLLEESGHHVWQYDQRVMDALFTNAPKECIPVQPRLWLVGCKHPEFPDLRLPKGSVVIDPFRYMPDQEGVEVVRIGTAAHDRQARAGGAVRSLAA